MRLYEIADEYRKILDDNLGDVTDEDVAAELEKLDVAFEFKVDNTTKYIANLKAESAALKEEETRLALRRKAADKRVESMRGYLKMCMEAAGKTKVKTTLFSLYFSKNQSVVVTDMSQLPAGLIRQADPEPNKSAIRDALRRGETVPGAMLRDSESLTIR